MIIMPETGLKGASYVEARRERDALIINRRALNGVARNIAREANG